jgi:hypothetical protein
MYEINGTKHTFWFCLNPNCLVPDNKWISEFDACLNPTRNFFPVEELQCKSKFGAGAPVHVTPLKLCPWGWWGWGVLRAIWDEKSLSFEENFSFGSCLKRSIHIAYPGWKNSVSVPLCMSLFWISSYASGVGGAGLRGPSGGLKSHCLLTKTFHLAHV